MGDRVDLAAAGSGDIPNGAAVRDDNRARTCRRSCRVAADVTGVLDRWIGRFAVGAALAVGAMVGFAPAATAQTNAEGTACATPGSSEWTSQERWVWERLCDHETADLNAFAGPADPDLPDTWTPEHIVRPEFLEAVLLDGPYDAELAGRGVWIKGAWFKTAIDLADTRIDGALFLDGSRFDGPLRLDRAQVDGRFVINGSTLNDGVILSGATIAGTVILGDSAYQRVDLSAADIGGSVSANGSTFNDGLNLAFAHIGGFVSANGSTFNDELSLGFADIGGFVNAARSTFNDELDLSGARVRAP